MVMEHEHPPAPSSVGREFVRQYYTLLNQAPAHLHRFYNNNSSFIHGGLDSPQRPPAKVVIGQKLIHQKIQQLNFRDCHAKISQVDSQATLGDGVVVQVTGELSNSGQPMRRFTQTFVLAAQTPKKFYVHNDIFRYQDMLCNEDDDEETEGESGEGMQEEGDEGEVQGDIPIQQAPQHGFYNSSAPAPPHHMVAPPVPVVAAPITIVNGSAHPDEMSQHIVPVQPVLVPVLAAAPLPPPPRPLEEEPAPAPAPAVEPLPAPAVEQPIPVEHVEPEEVPREEKVEVPFVEPVNEPKTYATLLKSGPISFASAAGGGGFASTIMQPPAAKQSEYVPAGRPDHRDGFPGRGGMGGRPQRGASVRGVGRDTNSRPPLQQHQQQQRQSFNEDHDSSNNSVGGNDGGSVDRDRRRGGPGSSGGPVMYSDNHQLFLGNLPHNATAEDLKEVFKKYGTVVDLRIHSKLNGKGSSLPGGARVPNYGFVTYEVPASVQEVLASRPIFYPDENGAKLNVEEKKTRPRHSMDRSSEPARPAEQPRSDYNGRGGGGAANNNSSNNNTVPPRGGGMRGGVNRGRGGFRGGASMRGGGGGNANNFPPRR